MGLQAWGFVFFFFFFLPISAKAKLEGGHAVREQLHESFPDADEVAQLRKIGDHPSVKYFWNSNSWIRLRAVEALDSTKMNEDQKSALQLIADMDPNPHVRREALLAATGGETRGMAERKDRETLKEIGDLDSLKYRWEDKWYDRLKTIENLWPPLSGRQKDQLKIVAEKDPDWRIRDEASNLLNGIPTRAMTEVAERARLEKLVGNVQSIGYYWSAHWAERHDAVQYWHGPSLGPEAIAGLKSIALHDPHPIIRRDAQRVVDEYNQSRISKK